MTIKDTQELLRVWVEKHPSQSHSDITQLTLLTEKMRELIRKSTISQDEISGEISDILWSVILLANRSNIDLTTAFIDNLELRNNHK